MIFFRSSEFRALPDLKHCVIFVTDSLTRRRFQDSVGFEAPCCDDSIARDHLQLGQSSVSSKSHTPLVGSTILYKLMLQDLWYSWCLPYFATREVKTQASVQSHTLLHYNSCSILLIYKNALLRPSPTLTIPCSTHFSLRTLLN